MRRKTPNPIPLGRVHMTTTQRPRGRPVTGQAKPAKVRMAAMRQRTLALLQDSQASLQGVPVSGLLEALRVGYRAGQTWEVVDVCAELLARLNEAPGASLRVKATFKAY